VLTVLDRSSPLFHAFDVGGSVTAVALSSRRGFLVTRDESTGERDVRAFEAPWRTKGAACMG
jgi:hypothetical protein